MTLKETISKRKSTRKYDPSPLDADILQNIQSFIKNVKPLYAGIEVRFDILPVKKVKGMTNAPYFIAAYSENKEGAQTNIGFMLQQTDLYIQSIGLGSCWLGSARPIEKRNDNLEFAIALAFGKAAGSPHRELSGFKRKPLEKISDTADTRLEQARLAPSAINSQPWYFVSAGEGFDCYRAKKFPSILYESFTRIDMGIALAHLFVSHPETFAFSVKDKPNPLNGHCYTGSVRI